MESGTVSGGARSPGLGRRTSRRALLKGLTVMMAVGAVAPLAIACSQQTPAPAKPAETKPAETKPAAPAATTAPAAAAKPAEPKPAAAAAKPEPKLGDQPIGKLEGPTVVTDPAQFPKTFKEAPMLAELVKAGKLPPVEQRLPAEPLVIKPLKEIGKYGGTWRRGFTGPFDTSNVHRAGGNDKLIFFDYTGTKLVPNVAKSWEVSPDGKVTTLTLRKGMKWSDGQPFTSDDFVFWFEDVYQNKDLVPTPIIAMSINGKPIKIEKGDETTVKFVAPDPYYVLPTVLAGILGLGHHSRFGRDNLGAYAPAHYMKQFHPKYAGEDAIKKMAADAKFDTWMLFFRNRNDATRNPDLPVLTPWVITSPITNPTMILERNPYAMW